MRRFANPARFLRISSIVLPWAAGATVVLMIVGLYLSLFASPADYQQGDTVRIMYIHVPAAWIMNCSSTPTRRSRRRRAGLKPPAGRPVHQGRSPIGAGFGALPDNGQSLG